MFRNVIYAENVHRGNLQFHLSLLTRVRRKTEAVLYDSISQMGPFCAYVFWHQRRSNRNFRIVNANQDASWYAIRIIRLNSTCFMQQIVIVYLILRQRQLL